MTINKVGHPPTSEVEVAKVYQVKSHLNVIGQVHVDESTPGAPGAIPTFGATDIHSVAGSHIPSSPERP